MTDRHEPVRLDLSEKGRDPNGQPLSVNRRLFFQLLAFGGCNDIDLLIEDLKKTDFRAALYLDANDPEGVALVTASEKPDFFVGQLRNFLNGSRFKELFLKPEFTMFGRTYTIGYEENPERVLVERPMERLLNPEWPWVVWYPVRRAGAFERVSREEQREMMIEHSKIAMAYTNGGYCYDIRLACHGLDKNDNDFILGLMGGELHPLSRIVQDMRKSRQTSEFLEEIGPFFVGKVVWQSASGANGGEGERGNG
ncbi:MAG: chlorite dismutase family protein [Verrucomicrobia bacterium]|nr:chlorite dismutase family protein [Verrucomicrobiota bacterium]